MYRLLEGANTTALVDLGAKVNVISKRLSVCLGLKYSSAEHYNIKLVSGPKVDFKEVINSVLVKVKGLSFLVFFFVLRDTYYYCILG